MKVVTTLHPPSAVLSSVKCSLSAKSELGHLVVAKPNRIEVSSLQAEGLKAECSLEIWGRIMSIRAVPAEVRRIFRCGRIDHDLMNFTDSRSVEYTRIDRSPRSQAHIAQVHGDGRELRSYGCLVRISVRAQ